MCCYMKVILFINKDMFFFSHVVHLYKEQNSGDSGIKYKSTLTQSLNKLSVIIGNILVKECPGCLL